MNPLPHKRELHRTLWRDVFYPAVAASVIALSPALSGTAAAAAPDAAAFSSRCASCHSTEPGKNGIGPSLAGIYGSTSGTVPGYTFSSAMKNAKIVWNDQTLDKFLQNPAGTVHGTKMFASVPDAAARQQIIAYLQTLKPQAAAGK
jgi:cytochrome c